MKKVVLFVMLLLSFSSSVSAQKNENPSDNIQTVDYCSVKINPDLYNGKTIRVTGIYRRGFEVSTFYSSACFDDTHRRPQTWVENFYGAKISSGRDTSAIRETFLSGRAGSDLEVTLTGVFRGSKKAGGFGHLNGYEFEIEVSSIEETRLLPKEVFGCKRIDLTKPFHYLSYERIENGISPKFEKSKDPKSEKLIYIRLVNNTTCSIRVPTIDGPNTPEIKDRSEIPVVYTLSSPCVRVSSRSITQLKQAFSVLSTGNSIYFTVPLRLLTKEPYEIRIPFDSQADKSERYYEPFYFSRYDLPENQRTDLDCTKY